MKSQLVANMHMLLDYAAAYPEDFYFSVIVVGKGDRAPMVYGTVSSELLAMLDGLTAADEDAEDERLAKLDDDGNPHRPD